MDEFDEGQQLDDESNAPEQFEEAEQDESYEETDEEQLENGEGDEPDDSEELEFRGSKVRLPKDIAEGVRAMQKDYTEKTMTVAEQRKSVENFAKFQQEFSADLTNLAIIEDQIKQIDAVDLNQIADEDQAWAQKLLIRRQMLESQRMQAANQVAQKKQEWHLNQQQEFAKQLEASETLLKREIKNWSPEVENKMVKHVVDNFGLTEADVRNAKTDPRLYKLLHAAFVGHQLMSKATSTTKPKPQPAAPVTKLRASKGGTSRSPGDMSTAAYAKWRRQGQK